MLYHTRKLHTCLFYFHYFIQITLLLSTSNHCIFVSQKPRYSNILLSIFHPNLKRKRTKIWEKTRIIFLFVFQRILCRNALNSRPRAPHPQLFVSRHWNLHAYRCLLTLNDATFQLSFNEYAAKTERKTWSWPIVQSQSRCTTLYTAVHIGYVFSPFYYLSFIAAHRSMISAKLIQKAGGSFDLGSAQVHYERWVIFCL